MQQKLTTVTTTNTEPYRNLALEELMLKAAAPGECLLYLWQNRRTVVIGRNQNARMECNIERLESDGGFLARRLSGGGAVFHDMGNLNFTFLARTGSYDAEKQTDVILRAVRLCGINAERTGRNDLVADGRKFSGHAYYKSGSKCYHHGTLMVDVDTEMMSKYLNVSASKLASKGVRSVRSRVVNLRELSRGLSLDVLKDALVKSFSDVFGSSVEILTDAEYLKGIPGGEAALERGRERFASKDWLYGNPRTFDKNAEARFDWGLARVEYTINEGLITEAALWTDGLDADLLSALPDLMTGLSLDVRLPDTLARRAADLGGESVARDIAELLLRNDPHQ